VNVPGVLVFIAEGLQIPVMVFGEVVFRTGATELAQRGPIGWKLGTNPLPIVTVVMQLVVVQASLIVQVIVDTPG
jgi:hypothetical protein